MLMKITFKAVQIKRNHDKRICQSSDLQRLTIFSFNRSYFTVVFEKIRTGSSQKLHELNHGSK